MGEEGPTELRRPWWPAAVVGLVAGFLSGLFGVGGGIAIVPGLVLVLKMDQRRAHGTSLAAALPIATSGAIGFALAGKVDWAASLPILLGGAAGAVIGTKALQVLPTRALRIGFALVLAATAVRLLVEIPSATARAPLDALSILGLVLLGVASGTLAGLMGVGGGVVIVPALMLLWGLSAPVAKGTSLVVIIGTAVVGTVQNLRHRNVDVRAAVVVGLAGTVAAFGAALISVHLEGSLANDLFAALLLVVAARIALSVRQSPDLAGRGVPSPEA